MQTIKEEKKYRWFYESLFWRPLLSLLVFIGLFLLFLHLPEISSEIIYVFAILLAVGAIILWWRSHISETPSQHLQLAAVGLIMISSSVLLPLSVERASALLNFGFGVMGLSLLVLWVNIFRLRKREKDNKKATDHD